MNFMYGKSCIWPIRTFLKLPDKSNLSKLAPLCVSACLSQTKRCSATSASTIATLDESGTTETNRSQSSLLERFRSKEENPAEHGLDDLNLMYTIPKEHYQRMVNSDFNTKAFPLKFQHLANVFNEACVMIRKPGLEVVNYLKHTDKNATINRYLLYGKTGSGKSVTLQYAVHYCMNENWLILPNNYIWDWINYRNRYKEHQKQEILKSQYHTDRVDQPENSVRWLEIFRLMNQSHLNKLCTTKKYIWSKHEYTDKGATFGTLVDHGIARPRNAPDVVGCIMKEVREQDHTTMPPTLVSVDCINALFGITTLKIQQGVFLDPHELSFFHNLKKLVANTWKNGAVVAALNCRGMPYHTKRVEKIVNEHPYDILGHEGFDWLDPHIPINVPNYNDQEVLALLAYYKDRKWLTGRSLTPQAEAEILQLCGNNPQDLVDFCGGLY